MEHFLGIILEIVDYVNATQNSSDGAALTNVGARQLPATVVVPLVGVILSTLVFVSASIVWISDDDPVRANDVEYLIAL